MNKELKQSIREDEFRTGISQAGGWLTTHRDEARVTAIVLAVVVLGGWAFVQYRSQRTERADKAFQAAAEIYHAPVATEMAPGAVPTGTVYATAAEKNQKALAAFDTVAREHASVAAGRRAQYYAALCKAALGQNAEAEKDLQALSGRGGPDPLVASLARLALADLNARTGQNDKAIDLYRQIVEDPEGPMPRDHALMHLAAAQEAAQKSVEARASYRRLTEEFPTSVYASEARRKADLIVVGQG